MTSGHRPIAIALARDDSVWVACTPLDPGDLVTVGARSVRVLDAIGVGHKVAARAIAAGEPVIKFNAPIGSATADIAAGAHVHTHNLKSDYLASHTLEEAREAAAGASG